MTSEAILQRLRSRFRSQFGRFPTVAAWAPGRIEVLGNHTDYNEGLVLSAAIQLGACFVAAPREDRLCKVVAADVREEVEFDLRRMAADKAPAWANYVRGVLHGLARRAPVRHGLDAMFLGNLPLGCGLSSSAALEMSAGLVLAELYGIRIGRSALAVVGQEAEHRFVGVRCGLMDQLTSLAGQRDRLVLTDFRTLRTRTAPFGEQAGFLMCNTNARQLADGKYNARRRSCEAAAAFFRKTLGGDVQSLRDVSEKDWRNRAPGLRETDAKRAAHVIGENARVRAGARALARGDLTGFGRLMFESHESSRHNFENSSQELDFLVECAAGLPGVLGARLSGGGFGGSALLLVRNRDAKPVARRLAAAYRTRFGTRCDARLVHPSDGAHRLDPAGGDAA